MTLLRGSECLRIELFACVGRLEGNQKDEEALAGWNGESGLGLDCKHEENLRSNPQNPCKKLGTAALGTRQRPRAQGLVSQNSGALVL